MKFLVSKVTKPQNLIHKTISLRAVKRSSYIIRPHRPHRSCRPFVLPLSSPHKKKETPPRNIYLNRHPLTSLLFQRTLYQKKKRRASLPTPWTSKKKNQNYRARARRKREGPRKKKVHERAFVSGCDNAAYSAAGSRAVVALIRPTPTPKSLVSPPVFVDHCQRARFSVSIYSRSI